MMILPRIIASPGLLTVLLGRLGQRNLDRRLGRLVAVVLVVVLATFGLLLTVVLAKLLLLAILKFVVLVLVRNCSIFVLFDAAPALVAAAAILSGLCRRAAVCD